MRSINALQPSHRAARRRPVAKAWRQAVESLESRTLFNATLSAPVAPLSVPLGTTTPATIDLNAHFTDPNVTGTVVQMNVPINNQINTFYLTLADAKAPQTVASFLHYVNTGLYVGTVIHRVVPGRLMQGGGFLPNQTLITQATPPPSEGAGISNTVGTIALAQGANIGSAPPSEWFINLANNTDLDSGSGGRPYTAFGKVLYSGMSVVNQVATLPLGQSPPNFVPDTRNGDPAGGALPLQNYSGGAVGISNYVTLGNVQVVAPLVYTVSSDNAALVNPSVSSNTLTLNYGAGMGTAHVTVTATDLAGNIAQSTFAVSVGQTQVTLGTGGVKLVRFSDPDGTTSQVSVVGPGTATLTFSGTGLTTVTGKGGVVDLTGTPTGVAIATAGTTAATTLNITGKGGNGLVDFNGITTGALRAINGRNTHLTGDLAATGGVGTVILNSTGGGTITLAGGAGSLQIGNGGSESVTAAAPIKLVSAGSWGAGGTIQAPSIGKIVIKGSFAPNLSTGSLGSFTAGSITGGAWTASPSSITAKSISNWTTNLTNLGKLTTAGALNSSSIGLNGNSGSLMIGSLLNTVITTGTTSTLPVTVQPPGTPANIAEEIQTAQGFSATSSSVASLRVLKAFADSDLLIASLRKADLGTVQASNGGSAFGVLAHQIGSLTAKVGGKKLKLANVTTSQQVATALASQGISLQDMIIGII